MSHLDCASPFLHQKDPSLTTWLFLHPFWISFPDSWSRGIPFFDLDYWLASWSKFLRMVTIYKRKQIQHQLSHLYKAFIEAKIVSNRVFPTRRSSLEKWKMFTETDSRLKQSNLTYLWLYLRFTTWICKFLTPIEIHGHCFLKPRQSGKSKNMRV